MIKGMTDLPTLLKRLQEAESESRLLDAMIERAFYNEPGYELGPLAKEDGFYLVKERDKTSPRVITSAARFYTASIDAALGLVERELPDTAYNLLGWKEKSVYTFLILTDKKANSIEEQAKTAPLAILTALIKAKIAELENQELSEIDDQFRMG